MYAMQQFSHNPVPSSLKGSKTFKKKKLYLNLSCKSLICPKPGIIKNDGRKCDRKATEIENSDLVNKP